MCRTGRGGFEVTEIPHSGHWLMYSTAPEMWKRIADFVTRTSVGHAIGHIEDAVGAGTEGQEGQHYRAGPRAWR
jgi:hypothetical protein